MTKTSTLKAIPVTLGLLLLGACATTGASNTAKTTTVTAEKASEIQATKEVADQLTQTKRTAKSEDGKLICKRTATVGSRFHKKVCATADEWAARAAADRKTTEGIQRSAGPGVSN